MLLHDEKSVRFTSIRSLCSIRRFREVNNESRLRRYDRPTKIWEERRPAMKRNASVVGENEEKREAFPRGGRLAVEGKLVESVALIIRDVRAKRQSLSHNPTFTFSPYFY